MKQKITSAITACLLSIAVVVTPTAELLPGTHPARAEAKARMVYYVPGSSYAYHSSKNCRALSRSKGIKKISMKKAKAKGLKACRMKGCW